MIAIGVSLKFKFINENGGKLLRPLMTNLNFLRYIKCLSNDPLNEEISLAELYKDIKDDGKNNGNIVLKKFDDKVLTEIKIKVFFSPFRPRDFTKILYSDIYTIDILIPNIYWILEGYGTWRAFAMAYEISKEIDNQNIAGLGKCEIVDWISDKYNDTYSYLKLVVKVDNASLSG